MPNLYADENFAKQVTLKLRELGHDVLTIADDGLSSQRTSDENVLKRATKLERILITFNRKDFIKLHNQNERHSGIIVCTIDSDFDALALRIHKELSDQSNFAGQLIRINRPNP